LKNYIKNCEENRRFWCKEITKALYMKPFDLTLKQIKGFFWEIGTHYYLPNQKFAQTRESFIKECQFPYPNIQICGEVVAKSQGWTEGGLQSVENVFLS